MLTNLIHGDCLAALADLEPASVDFLFADLPYGTTACAWDSVIPFDDLWPLLNRVCKPSAAMVFTAAQPFTTALIGSNLKAFRYSLVWDKVNRTTGALNANRQPLRRHEDIAVFYRRLPTFNPQMSEGAPYVTSGRGHGAHTAFGKSGPRRKISSPDGRRFPTSLIAIKAQNGETQKGLHPTQKPVALIEYLIATYSNPGDVVLDPTMGSGTTGVAALNLGRGFVGIERDDTYFATASARIAES